LEEEGETEIDILKVDVEGHELEVLKGAQRLLERLSTLLLPPPSSYSLLSFSPLLPSSIHNQ
jgi:hypothetical protein